MSDNTSRAAYGGLRERLSGVAMILHSAEANDLPAPRIVGSFSADSPLVTLHFASYDDLAAWSTWVEELIEVVEYAPHHHAVEGSMFEQEFRLVFIGTARKPVSA